MKTAWLNLRYSPADRIELFRVGLARLGYRAEVGLPAQPVEVLITWNRIGRADEIASRCERVIVAENAAWGNDWQGGRWLSLARDRHNTSGMFPAGDEARWDALHVELKPWRSGGETVILPQRGIGSAPTAMPPGWLDRAYMKYRGRIRHHPGMKPSKPLREDLADCGRAVTWGSGAAIKALIWGIPVISEMPGWIGEQDNTDIGRLSMLQRLAWAQWRHSEIESGAALDRLLA